MNTSDSALSHVTDITPKGLLQGGDSRTGLLPPFITNDLDQESNIREQ